MSARDELDSPGRLRVPPHSVEAEQSVLGGLLLDNGAWDRAAHVLTDADFYRLEHRLIFGAIRALITAERPADVITVLEQLQRSGKADESGGLAYLNALAGSVPSAANMRRYAEIVRERAMLRQSIGALDQALSALWVADADAAGAIDRAASTIAAMQAREVRSVPHRLGDVLVERAEHVGRLQSGAVAAGWDTGFPSFDRLIGGLRPGALYYLAARPSVGKSSLAQAIAINVARQQLPGLVLSMEMNSGELADRAISMLGDVDHGRLCRGEMSELDWAQLSTAVQAGGALPIHLDDQPSLRLSDIRTKARLVKGLKFLVVDYLQLCASSGGRATNRNNEIEEISRGLKALAKDLGIAVIALSQLNREPEKRVGGRPILSDLRDSGAIEQDADAVILMWTVREFERTGRRIVGIDVAKNRHGKRGAFGLEFFGATQTWREGEDLDITPDRPAPRRNGDDL